MRTPTSIRSVDTVTPWPVKHAETVVRKRHINWTLKAVLPIAAVLLNGLLLFMLVSSSLDSDSRNGVIAVAAGGAFVVCVAVIMVLAVQICRHMLELRE